MGGQAVLQIPFRSLDCDDFISRGSAGQVFAVSPRLVLKFPTSFTNPAPEQVVESEESRQKIEHEKSIYQMMMDFRHPHLVRAILCAPEGIFLERLRCTLRCRLDDGATTPITPTQEMRWITQLTSAVEWLATLDYAHGDLRPANIHLDERDVLKIADFDATVRFGQRLLVATAPFCKLQDDYEPPIASSTSEQYSLGSCIYTVRNRKEPFHDLEGPEMARRLIDGKYSDTSHDTELGPIIQACWRGDYTSIQQLKRTIFETARCLVGNLDDKCETTCLDGEVGNDEDPPLSSLITECEDFLLRNRPISSKKEVSTWYPCMLM